MRITLIIVLLLFWQATFSQTYKFNQVTSYNVNYQYELNAGIINKIIYWNKDDLSYCLNVYDSNDNLYATLSDFKAKEIHLFDVVKIPENESFILDFRYVNTREIRNVFLDQVYDYKITKKDSLSTTTIITSYKNKRKKKINYQCEVKLDKAGQNIVPFLQIHDFDGGGAIGSENHLPKGFVRELSVLNIPGEEIWKLEYTKNVGFAIRVIEKKIYIPIQLNK